MTLRRDARRVRHAGALLCLGALVQACQWLLVFTPESSADGGAVVGDAALSDASAIDVAEDVPSPDANDGGPPGCAARADAAFCVDFSSDADLSPDAWLNVDPNIRLSTEGATSPPFAARMETTSNGPPPCAYQFLNRVLPARPTKRIVFAASISSTTEGFPIAMSLLQGSGDAVLLGGLFHDQLQILAQQAASGGASSPALAIQVGAVHSAEMVLERTVAGTIEVTFRLREKPDVAAKLELPASLAMDHVAIILGVWNQCTPSVVTVDDVAVWFD